MIDMLVIAAEQAEGAVRPAALTFLRVGAAVALLPAFGEQSIPIRIRLGVALAFTAVVFPAVAADYRSDAVLLSAVAEVMAGLVLGLALRFLVMALQLAASIAAQSASLSQLFAAAGAEPMPALGSLLTMAALALAVQADLHVQFAALLISSYEILPAETILTPAEVLTWGVGAVARVMSLAVSLATPFVIGALLWNMTLGFINRAMPHLSVAFVGAPALSLGALALAALAAPFMIEVWLSAFRDVVRHPFAGGSGG